MFGIGIFAGILAVGFAVAKLRSRTNSRPSVTSLMSKSR